MSSDPRPRGPRVEYTGGIPADEFARRLDQADGRLGHFGGIPVRVDPDLPPGRIELRGPDVRAHSLAEVFDHLPDVDDTAACMLTPRTPVRIRPAVEPGDWGAVFAAANAAGARLREQARALSRHLEESARTYLVRRHLVGPLAWTGPGRCSDDHPAEHDEPGRAAPWWWRGWRYEHRTHDATVLAPLFTNGPITRTHDRYQLGYSMQTRLSARIALTTRRPDAPTYLPFLDPDAGGQSEPT